MKVLFYIVLFILSTLSINAKPIDENTTKISVKNFLPPMISDSNVRNNLRVPLKPMLITLFFVNFGG